MREFLESIFSRNKKLSADSSARDASPGQAKAERSELPNQEYIQKALDDAKIRLKDTASKKEYEELSERVAVSSIKELETYAKENEARLPMEAFFFLKMSIEMKKQKEKVSLPNVIEATKREVKGKVDSAKRNALDAQGMSVQAIDAIAQRYVSTGKKDALVTVRTLSELRYALEEIGLDRAQVIETLAHENAHGNMADSIHDGAHLEYSAVLVKQNGRYYAVPLAQIKFPDAWSDEKENDAFLKVIAAPEKYGNTLSPADKDMLRRGGKK